MLLDIADDSGGMDGLVVDVHRDLSDTTVLEAVARFL